MADMQIISEIPINIYELKKELERIKKIDGELNHRANRTDEYITQILMPIDASVLFDKISKLGIPRIKDQHIHKIIDVCPTTLNELKVVLQGYTITISNDSMKKIIDLINELIKAKK